MPMTSSFSSRSLDRMVSPSTNSTLFPNSRLQTPVTSMGPSYPQPVPNPSNFTGRTLGLPNPPATTVQRTLQPTPVAPTPPVTLSGRLPNPGAPQTTAVFKPIPQQQQQPQPSARPESNVNSRPPAPHTRPSTVTSFAIDQNHFVPFRWNRHHPCLKRLRTEPNRLQRQIIHQWCVSDLWSETWLKIRWSSV